MNEEYIVKAGVEFLSKNFDSLFARIKHFYKDITDEVRISWRTAYKSYLDCVSRKYFYAKPFLSSNTPTPLYDFYTPLNVTCGETQVSNTSIKDLILANKFAVIMANAGSGKSMLMRHLFLDTIKNTDQVPILVELRDLNNYSLTLFELITKKLRDNKFDLDDEYIEKALQVGHFAILLDGFDEIAHDKRDEVMKSIQELADKYEQNYLVLSSRPDDSLYKWTLFDVWEVQPLSEDLACLLIDKTSEDEELKSRFVRELREGLFEKHESFLSNPLLLSIMLITYKDSANIPQKLSTFYDRAYVSLFERHDAQKGAFSREKQSGLDIQEFKKVFSSFSFLTFGKRKLSFSETDIYEYFGKTQVLSGIQFNKKEFLEDSIQAVSLLVRDGLEITFTHRSFQEYFMAVYVSQIGDPLKKQKFVSKYFADTQFDLIQTLLVEIAPEPVEQYVIIPALEDLETAIEYHGSVHTDQYKRFLRALFSRLVLYYYPDDNSWQHMYSSNRLTDVYTFISYYYLGPQSEHDRSFHPNADIAKRISAGGQLRSDGSTKVELINVIEDEDKLQCFSQGTHSLSKSTLVKILNLKSRLIEKHKQQDAFLEEELLD